MKLKFCAEHLIVQLIVFWAAFALYRIVFTKDHFSFVNNRGDHVDDDLLTTLYFTMMAHAKVGAADVLPTSPLSRTFVAMHTLVAFALGSSGVVDLVASNSGNSLAA